MSAKDDLVDELPDTNIGNIPEHIEVYLVGGAVRDLLEGDDPNDYDYVFVDASEDFMDDHFKRVGVGDREHPVWLDRGSVLHEREDGEESAEIALAREEVSTGQSYTQVEYETDGVTIEDDLRRRDLTINAMAFNLRSEELVDPFGGRSHLEDRVARHVSEAFADDPVRVLRLARYVSRFGLRADPETLALARKMAPDLENEPIQRIRDEMFKAFKQARNPRRFFDTLRDVGALEHSFPILHEAIGAGTGGGGEYHQEGDLFAHTMLVLEQAQRINPNNQKVLLGALTHDLGKVKAYEDEHPDTRKHDMYDDFVLENLFRGDEAPLSNGFEKSVRDAVTQHMRVNTFANELDGQMGAGKRINMVLDHDENHNGLSMNQLFDIAEADSHGRIPQNQFDRGAFEKELDLVRQVVNDVDGAFVIDLHGWRNDDGEIEKPGEVIGDVIRQERIAALQNDGIHPVHEPDDVMFEKVRVHDPDIDYDVGVVTDQDGRDLVVAGDGGSDAQQTSLDYVEVVDAKMIDDDHLGF